PHQVSPPAPGVPATGTPPPGRCPVRIGLPTAGKAVWIVAVRGRQGTRQRHQPAAPPTSGRARAPTSEVSMRRSHGPISGLVAVLMLAAMVSFGVVNG